MVEFSHTGPRLAVSAGIFRDGKILLVRRAREPAKGVYTFPGGRVEFGESLTEALTREIREETGLTIAIVGLVGYRDRGDVYVTTKTELSNDIHAVYGQLIQFQAGGGGDWPESVNEALHVAVTKMGWSETGESRRIVFLVGDAPPHMDYAQDIPFTDTLKIAEREHILVNAVQAGSVLNRHSAQSGWGDANTAAC